MCFCCHEPRSSDFTYLAASRCTRVHSSYITVHRRRAASTRVTRQRQAASNRIIAAKNRAYRQVMQRRLRGPSTAEFTRHQAALAAHFSGQF